MQKLPCKNYSLIFDSVNRPVNSTYKANVFNNFLTFLTNFSVIVNAAVDISINSNVIVCGKILSGKDLNHIETSHFIYDADQSDGLCMVQVFEKKWFSNNLLCNKLLQYFAANSNFKGYSNF